MNRFALGCYAAAGCIAVLASAPANADPLADYTFHPGNGRNHIDGYVFEGIMEAPDTSMPDAIEIHGPQGLELIVVTCSPFDWSSEGPNTAAFADHIARAWCF